MHKLTKYFALTLALTTVSAAAQTRMAPEEIPEAGSFNFPGERIVLPLGQAGTHPMVTVNLGDGEQYQFIVDTGASTHVIDTALAEKLGYEVIGEMAIGAPGGAQVPGNIVRAPDFKVGEATISGAEFVTMDIQAFSMGTTHGVIGTAVFHGLLLSFDLAQNQISLERGELTDGEAGVMPYNDYAGHIQLDLNVAGTTVAAHIDTGSPGEFMLPGELLETLPIKGEPEKGPSARMVGGSRETQYATIDGDVVFAGHEFKQPKVTFMSPSTGYGNVGGAVFRKFVMTIDQTNQLIRFTEHEGDNAATMTGQPRRLGVGFSGIGAGAALQVSNVGPGSLAEAAGFIVGDTLVSLNGRAISDYAMPELGALIRGSESLAFEVERGGENKAINIP